MKKKVLFVALIVLCAALLGACAGTEPEVAIVGTWECQDDSISHKWMCLLIFDENGRFTDNDGDGGSFHITNDSLILDFDQFEAITFSYRLRGNRLTITGDDTRVVLTRR